MPHSISNLADSSSSRCSYASQAVTGYNHRHETTAAAVGLFRNLSCTEDLSIAEAIVAAGGVASCVNAFFGTWKGPAAAAAAAKAQAGMCAAVIACRQFSLVPYTPQAAALIRLRWDAPTGARAKGTNRH
jgi:hypothetical protein